MKKIALMVAALAATVSTTAHAADTWAEATKNAENPPSAALCPTLEKLAGSTMKLKQNGTAMSKVMEVANDPIRAESIRKVAVAMIMEAYAEPDYMTDAMKERQRTEFANKWALRCYNAAN